MKSGVKATCYLQDLGKFLNFSQPHSGIQAFVAHLLCATVLGTGDTRPGSEGAGGGKGESEEGALL